MKKYVVLLGFMLLANFLYAQEREIIQASSGKDLTEKISNRMQYLFPEFTNGNVLYKAAAKGSGKMNYNMLLGEMQFLDVNDKVLALDNVSDVVLIVIDGRKFYPFEKSEFTEELVVTPKVQLRVRRKGNVASHSKQGAYGTTSSTEAITSYSSIGSGNRTYELTVADNVMVTVNNLYYLVSGQNKHVMIKNQKTFTKQFPGHKAQIEAFVKEHDLRFDNENDLKVLVEYCGKL